MRFGKNDAGQFDTIKVCNVSHGGAQSRGICYFYRSCSRKSSFGRAGLRRNNFSALLRPKQETLAFPVGNWGTESSNEPFNRTIYVFMHVLRLYTRRYAILAYVTGASGARTQNTKDLCTQWKLLHHRQQLFINDPAASRHCVRNV